LAEACLHDVPAMNQPGFRLSWSFCYGFTNKAWKANAWIVLQNVQDYCFSKPSN